MSKIEWTEKTWNPAVGCTPCSPACEHCYAKRQALRLQRMGLAKYRNGFRVTLHPECLEEPLRWKKPCMVFPCSMSDLFHADVPDEFRDQVFDTMERADWHRYQLLTKRVHQCVAYLNRRHQGRMPGNIWTGFTAWDQASFNAGLEAMRGINNPAVLYCSLEPLLGPVRITGPVDWLIVGGESGPGARPMDEVWVRTIVADCAQLDIPVFYKQRIAGGRKISMPEIDGKVYGEYPVSAGVRREKATLFT